MYLYPTVHTLHTKPGIRLMMICVVQPWYVGKDTRIFDGLLKNREQGTIFLWIQLKVLPSIRFLGLDSGNFHSKSRLHNKWNYYPYFITFSRTIPVRVNTYLAETGKKTY